jgi:hypothetical protein
MKRRDFIKSSSLFVSAHILKPSTLFVLGETIIQSLINRAVAAQAGVQPLKKWVDFMYIGAPPNWHYDLFLLNDPNDANNLMANKMVSNWYGARTINKKTVYCDPIYKTRSVKVGNKTLTVPEIWGAQVPTSGSGTRPMTDLLPHLLSIRGISTGNATHSGNQTLHYLAPGSSVSLPALGAALAKSPIPAVYTVTNGFSYRSKTSKSAVRMVSNGNYIKMLLEPFLSKTDVSQIKNGEALVQSDLNRLREALASKSTNLHPENRVAQESLKGARELIQRQFGDLSVLWNSLVGKYSDLIKRSFQTKVPGLNDQPVGLPLSERTQGDPTYTIVDRTKDYLITTEDLNTLITEQTTVFNMAESFALAEFILLNNLSDSVSLQLSVVSGINIPGITGPQNISYDQHFVGSVPGILINNLTAIAYASCLLEFIQTLGPDLWKNVVLNCSGEMVRNPDPSGRGSDHSASANMTLFSGAITEPIVVGNILKNGTQAGYPGTWGTAGPVKDLNNEPVQLTHAHNTAAVLLGLPAPIAARPSLVVMKSDGTVVQAVADGKIV